MKELRMAALLLVLTLAIGGCKNSCDSVTCLNSGVCNDGKCECAFRYGGLMCDSLCPQGYEGQFCNQLIRQKFIRQWSATTASPNGTITNTLTITAGAAASFMNITNFNNEGFTMTGIVSGKTTFDIYEQTVSSPQYTGKVTGSGTYSNNRVSMYLYKENGASYFATCNP